MYNAVMANSLLTRTKQVENDKRQKNYRATLTHFTQTTTPNIH
jgi:hypothetical protein